WIGYNEAMILYVLAIGSPTKPVPSAQWATWTSGYQWNSWYGQSYLEFAPLFGHQYSHAWIDFRGIQDAYMRNRGITYFENSRRATLAQHAYCVANPLGWIGYADSLWGITASDDPSGYLAHGAPPAQNENGTLTPTAALSSIAFTPELSVPFAHKMWNTYRTQGWGPYGFTDAFNLTQDWWGSAVLGIDQGPILLMIENHRTQSVWNRFMQNADVQRGLTLAGFGPVTSAVDGYGSGALRLVLGSANPTHGATQLRYRLVAPVRMRLEVFDVAGRLVEVLAEGDQAAGEHAATFRGAGLPGGLYLVRLEAAGQIRTQRIVRLH
ncbi:MAG: glucoamylase family protein, partial [Candidatus Eisenbacteria bacterium]